MTNTSNDICNCIDTSKLTKRECLSGMVLHALLSNRTDAAFGVEVEVWAKHAVRCADALLKELEKQT